MKKFMMMGSYVKVRLMKDNFKGMKDEEIIKDVRNNMDKKSKYINKDVMECVNWYRKDFFRKGIKIGG